MLQIEDGVPIPPRGRTSGIRLELNQVKVGQSFRIPTEGYKNVQAAIGSVRVMAERSGIGITIRKMTDCYRCWRVS